MDKSVKTKRITRKDTSQGFDNSTFIEDVLTTEPTHDVDCETASVKGNEGSAWKLLPSKIRWYVYISHFLSAWGDRMWQFGVGMFMVIISPDSLRVTAVYGLSMGVAVLLFGALVGDWVDKTPRLSAARASLVLQNVSVIVCAGIVYVVITYKPEIQEMWPNEGLLTLSYGGIIVVAIVSTLASTANTIAVERDWIVEICGTDKDMLASTSATLKSIDLLTNMVAPIATGQIMTYASVGIGALFIGGWNLVSVFFEYYLLWKVYDSVPALKAKKDKPRIDKESVNDNRDITAEVSSAQDNIPNQMRDKPDNGADSEPTFIQKLFSGILVLGRGWKTYMKYDVAFAGLALSMLYMTVLGFDNVTVGFAYTQGVNESIMGILMAAGGLFGILGTVIYPRLRKSIGLVRTGLFGLFFQVMVLSLCVVSIWAPGSPFDPFYWKREETNSTFTNIDYNTSTVAAERLTMNGLVIPVNLSEEVISPTHVIHYTTAYYTVNALNDTTPIPMNVTDSSWTSLIAVSLLMAGIIGARCGLWMTDLTITQLFLERIEERERGIVLGVQTSLNQLMDMLKFVMVVVAPQPEVFGVLILISFGFVSTGWLLYAKYSYSVREHLFHFGKMNCFDKKIKALAGNELELDKQKAVELVHYTSK